MANPQEIQGLPSPKNSRGGAVKVTILALLAVAIVGGAAFWLTRDTTERRQMTEKLNEAVQDTPLASVTQLLTPPPPPPPPRSGKPTDPGTLSGPNVHGTVPSPVDTTGATGENAGDAATSSNVMPKVEEDSRVRSLFVEDLAQWLVARYHPGKDGGNVQWSVSALNMRYGGQLRGITFSGEDVPTGRAAILRYAFNPPMLNALYNLYIDRFVEAMGRVAMEPSSGKALTSAQVDDMYKAYATRFAALGSALNGIASLNDFTGRMSNVRKAAQQVTAVQVQMAEAVFALDEAREAGDKGKTEAAQLRLSGLTAQFQRLLGERDTAQHNMLSAIRQSAPGARGVDDDTLVFVANWVERRLLANAENAQAVLTASRLLEDLAGRLRMAGSIAR